MFMVHTLKTAASVGGLRATFPRRRATTATYPFVYLAMPTVAQPPFNTALHLQPSPVRGDGASAQRPIVLQSPVASIAPVLPTVATLTESPTPNFLDDAPHLDLAPFPDDARVLLLNTSCPELQHAPYRPCDSLVSSLGPIHVRSLTLFQYATVCF